MKKIFIVIILLAILSLGFLSFRSFVYKDKVKITNDYKNIEYTVEGKKVLLKDGYNESPIAPDSATKVITKYFGNEISTDLNADNTEDIVFLLTQDGGGSGTFYYVVGAISTPNGYVGTDAVFIGDRIAPQSINLGSNGIVIINYADRNPGEDFSVPPSLGKSIWLKLDLQTMQWGEVAQNFEGESDPSKMTLGMKKWDWINTVYSDGTEVVPKHQGDFSITMSVNGSFSLGTDCNSGGGEYTVNGNKISFGNIISTLKYCAETQETEYFSFFENAESFSFTSKGEFILNLKENKGKVIFK